MHIISLFLSIYLFDLSHWLACTRAAASLVPLKDASLPAFEARGSQRTLTLTLRPISLLTLSLLSLLDSKLPKQSLGMPWNSNP